MNLKRFITKLTTALATLLVVAAFTTTANAQDDVAAGEKLFTENCTACHAFSKDGQGPALAGVHERRKEDWLLKWIKNAPKMIADGDPIAVQLFDKHGPTVMNTFEYLEDNDIKNIIAYIKSNPSDPGAPEPPKEDGKITTTTPESNEASSSIKSLINFLIIAILIAVLLIIGSVFDVLGYTNASIFSSWYGCRYMGVCRTWKICNNWRFCIRAWCSG